MYSFVYYALRHPCKLNKNLINIFLFLSRAVISQKFFFSASHCVSLLFCLGNLDNLSLFCFFYNRELLIDTFINIYWILSIIKKVFSLLCDYCSTQDRKKFLGIKRDWDFCFFLYLIFIATHFKIWILLFFTRKIKWFIKQLLCKDFFLLL